MKKDYPIHMESEIDSDMTFLVKNAQAQAAIVVDQSCGEYLQWAADELKHYIQELSGAELPVFTPDSIPTDKSLIILGGPHNNPLADAAEKKQLVSFSNLNPGGFILSTIRFNNRLSIIIGGNDEASIMYAVYEILERLGMVFQLTGDIIPEKKQDLSLPFLNERIEPAFKTRGILSTHGCRWYMGLNEYKKEIDQMAKLKMNTMYFWFGMGSPWVEFSYDGKKAEIAKTVESGFCAWSYTNGTAEHVRVGRECFPKDGYMGPPEFSNVRTQDEAYAVARDFLREIIRYAHTRKIQVFLGFSELPYMPENMIGTKKKIHGYWCGAAVSYSDQDLLGIWESAVKSMVESYPEADRYLIGVGAEILVSSDDPGTQKLIDEYSYVREHINLTEPHNVAPRSDVREMYPAVGNSLESDIACIAVADKLFRRLKVCCPNAKFGAVLTFRGNMLKPLDMVLPKDIWLINMVNWNRWSAISSFEGIADRGLVVLPRITDDGCELHMQLNTMMYEHEQILSGSARIGLEGVVGQLNKARGAEQSTQFIAEGAWNPQLTSQMFYENYLLRLYGPDARETLLKAFAILEENDKRLGWHGRSEIFSVYCGWHGRMYRKALIKADLPQSKVSPRTLEGWQELACESEDFQDIGHSFGRQEEYVYDYEKVIKDLETREKERSVCELSALKYREALELLRQAQAHVLSGARSELDYVMFMTENFADILEMLVNFHSGYAQYDQALLTMNEGNAVKSHDLLKKGQEFFEQAFNQARDVAQGMITYAHIAEERHNLYLFNMILPVIEENIGIIQETLDSHMSAAK